MNGGPLQSPSEPWPSSSERQWGRKTGFRAGRCTVAAALVSGP